jgi:archaellum component FlaC
MKAQIHETILTETGYMPLTPLDPRGQIREGAEHIEKALGLLQGVKDLEPQTQEARETVEGLKYSVQYLRDLWEDMKNDVREVTES